MPNGIVAGQAWEGEPEPDLARYHAAKSGALFAGDAKDLGKPTGQDAALGSPNAVDKLGMDGAIARFNGLIAEGLDSMPQCPGRDTFRTLILAETDRFLPKSQLTGVA